MTGDLISRKVLMKHIETMSRRWGEDYDVNQVLGDIEDFPAIEVSSVVRCGECIHRRSMNQRCVGRRPDWFCADGERRG